ncbi:MAG: presqualene diphosphate synthase HpnD [bacterium]|nr:presqualene diphosphate synthase HpnD [bacterium]
MRVNPTKKAVRQSNFYHALFFLPRKKREAVAVLYAFARLVDDIVDEPGVKSEKEKELQFWREELVRCYQGKAQTELGRDLSGMVRSFQLTQTYFLELIDGVAIDLTKNRYATYEELCRYCYGVAGTVGLLCMEIFGLRDARAQRYAKALGQAFQLTNILRDVGTDLKMGRVYLPQEDLNRFGLSEEGLKTEREGAKFSQLILFEAERAKACFQEADSLLNPKEKSQVIASRIMAVVYYKILLKVIRSPLSVLRGKVSVSPFMKIFLVLKTWLNDKCS